MTATFTDALSTRRIKGGSGGVPQVVGALGSLVDARPRQSKEMAIGRSTRWWMA